MSDHIKFPGPGQPPLPEQPGVLDTVSISILESPTPVQIIKFMVVVGKLINRQLGVILANESFSSANPACQGLTAAGVSLEQGAVGLNQYMQQLQAQKKAQSGMIMPDDMTPMPPKLQ